MKTTIYDVLVKKYHDCVTIDEFNVVNGMVKDLHNAQLISDDDCYLLDVIGFETFLDLQEDPSDYDLTLDDFDRDDSYQGDTNDITDDFADEEIPF